MAYTHSHHCWVGVAPVREVETHQWARRPWFDMRIGLKSCHWDDAPSFAVIDSNCVGLTGPGALRRIAFTRPAVRRLHESSLTG